MIEEQFVSFDTAKMLKEAGFDAPCYVQNFNEDDWGYSCPTQALAARWLREIHFLHVYADRDLFAGKWFHVIRHTVNDATAVSDSVYETPEEAMEAGLQEAIKLIKK